MATDPSVLRATPTGVDAGNGVAEGDADAGREGDAGLNGDAGPNGDAGRSGDAGPNGDAGRSGSSVDATRNGSAVDADATAATPVVVPESDRPRRRRNTDAPAVPPEFDGRRRGPDTGARAAGGPDGEGPGRHARKRRRRGAPPRSKRRVRKVHRVIRHIEVWSVAKVAVVFAMCGYLIAMVSGYLLWRAADRVGTIEGIEGFMEDSGGYDTFEIFGDVVFRSAAAVGVVLAVVFVSIAVLGTLLFNLIADLTGGIRATVIDEDLIVIPARRPRGGEDPRRPRPAPDRSGPPAREPTSGGGRGD